MTIRSALAAIAYFGSLLTAPHATAAPTSVFRYEIVRQISPGEIWDSNEKFVQGTGGTILYLDFDLENAEEKGGWVAQGIILAGQGDLDSIPIAVRLWSRRPAHLNIAASKELSGKTDAVVAIFDLDSRSCPQKDACPSSQIQFSLTNAGKIVADGKVIGAVQ